MRNTGRAQFWKKRPCRAPTFCGFESSAGLYGWCGLLGSYGFYELHGSCADSTGPTDLMGHTDLYRSL